jgi:hypothetical protein
MEGLDYNVIISLSKADSEISFISIDLCKEDTEFYE